MHGWRALQCSASTAQCQPPRWMPSLQPEAAPLTHVAAGPEAGQRAEAGASAKGRYRVACGHTEARVLAWARIGALQRRSQAGPVTPVLSPPAAPAAPPPTRGAVPAARTGRRRLGRPLLQALCGVLAVDAQLDAVWLGPAAQRAAGQGRGMLQQGEEGVGRGAPGAVAGAGVARRQRARPPLPLPACAGSRLNRPAC